MQKFENHIDKNAKIAVLCGGMSSEKDISMRSGKGCYEALKRLGFVNAELVVTGCGVMASSLCMNKEYTKRILSTNKDIPLIKSVFVRKGEDVLEACKDLSYPLITKPVCEGSSFGMTKVNSKDELKAAYEEAAKYNDDVLIVEDDNKKFMEDYTKGRFTTYKAVKSFDEIKLNVISKLLLITYDENELLYYRDLFKEKFKGALQIVRSHKYYLEFTDINASKGNALKFLSDFWGIKKEITIMTCS